MQKLSGGNSIKHEQYVFKWMNQTSIYTDHGTASKIVRKLWIQFEMELINENYEEALTSSVHCCRKGKEDLCFILGLVRTPFIFFSRNYTTPSGPTEQLTSWPNNKIRRESPHLSTLNEMQRLRHVSSRGRSTFQPGSDVASQERGRQFYIYI